jgi:NAD(P)-dependent dehydrogenase (short-subunit alcohol dehydrogenase family)
MSAPEDEPLEGRTAIVTGGAGGIGTGISVRLAKEGANVVIAQRSVERGRKVADRIEELGVGSLFVETDLGDDDDIVALAEAAREEFGGTEIVVNTATHPGKERASEMSRELWDEILSVTLTAPFRLAQEVYPDMQDAGFGRVINIGAIQSFSPYAGSVGYASAKAGLEGLTRALAVEWGDDRDSDITANTVHVGVTPKGYNWDDYDAPLEVANDQISIDSDTGEAPTLVGRRGRPSDHAAITAFLASPEGGFFTGQVLNSAGGRLISRYPASQSHFD